MGKSVLVLAATGFAAVGFAWWWSLSAATVPPESRRVALYQDSMHPWVKSDQPGKCSICGMELTPIYDEATEVGLVDNVVRLRSGSVTVANVQTEPVERRRLIRSLRVAGALEADATRKTIIAAPAPGRIDNVTVESAGIDVHVGEVLATFYSPDLTFKTRRFIFRDRVTEHANPSARVSAFGGSSRHTTAEGDALKNQPLISQEQVNDDPYFNDLLSTQDGTVVERSVYDGQYVAEGDRLFTIVDCSTLWFLFDVYEQQLPWLEKGQVVEVSVPSLPGRVFPAVVAVIEPTLNEMTRTAKVRASVDNPLSGDPDHLQRALRLGMYADGNLRSHVADALVVPRSAILFPSGQAYVYVDAGAGCYEQRRVQLGRLGDDGWEVLEGLNEGEHVVTSGNVLIDAQAQFVEGRAGPGTGRVSEPVAVSRRPTPIVVAAEQAQIMPREVGDLELCGAGPVATPQEAVRQLLQVADGIAAALAMDDFESVTARAAALPAVVTSLEQNRWDDAVLQNLVDRIRLSARWTPAEDLAAARERFLPFSTSVVALVQRLRARDEAFHDLKIFKCPMAPAPGLWFQAVGPLQNPYLGVKMFSCGEEVPLTGEPATPAIVPVANATPARIVPDERPANVVRVSHAVPQPEVATQHDPADLERTAASLRARMADTQMRPEFAEPRTETDLTDALTTEQIHAFEAFLGVADGVSHALAADSLDGYREQSGQLAAVLADLEREFPNEQRVNALARRLKVLATSNPPQSIEEARKRFELFATNAVVIAKQVREHGAAMVDFHIYHCPMATAPGLWLQREAPLANPFFGSKMQHCGEEVAP